GEPRRLLELDANAERRPEQVRFKRAAVVVERPDLADADASDEERPHARVAPRIVDEVNVADPILARLPHGRPLVEDLRISPAETPLGAPVVIEVPTEAQAAEQGVRLLDVGRLIGTVAQERPGEPIEVERSIEPTAVIEGDALFHEASFGRRVVKAPMAHV